jgi:acid phosphatase
MKWQRDRYSQSQDDGAGFVAGMKEMLTFVQNRREGKTKHRFVLLSGHDSTVIACLGLLGHGVQENPPFASHLAMEVMEDPGHRPFVRWVFNGKTLQLPDYEGKEIVALDEFVEKMQVKIQRLCAA